MVTDDDGLIVINCLMICLLFLPLFSQWNGPSFVEVPLLFADNVLPFPGIISIALIVLNFVFPFAWFIVFLIFTIAVANIDVEPIGPEGSLVGFSGINGWIHGTVGVDMQLYTLTDWLGCVAIGIMVVFAVVGLAQSIGRRSICAVDGSLLALGCFYLLLFGAYILFNEVVINYRPVLIEGTLEPSYPSSTTLLVVCVAASTVVQGNRLLKSRRARIVLDVFCTGVQLVVSSVAQ